MNVSKKSEASTTLFITGAILAGIGAKSLAQCILSPYSFLGSIFYLSIGLFIFLKHADPIVLKYYLHPRLYSSIYEGSFIDCISHSKTAYKLYGVIIAAFIFSAEEIKSLFSSDFPSSSNSHNYSLLNSGMSVMDSTTISEPCMKSLSVCKVAIQPTDGEIEKLPVEKLTKENEGQVLISNSITLSGINIPKSSKPFINRSESSDLSTFMKDENSLETFDDDKSSPDITRKVIDLAIEKLLSRTEAKIKSVGKRWMQNAFISATNNTIKRSFGVIKFVDQIVDPCRNLFSCSPRNVQYLRNCASQNFKKYQMYSIDGISALKCSLSHLHSRICFKEESKKQYLHSYKMPNLVSPSSLESEGFTLLALSCNSSSICQLKLAGRIILGVSCQDSSCYNMTSLTYAIIALTNLVAYRLGINPSRISWLQSAILSSLIRKVLYRYKLNRIY